MTLTDIVQKNAAVPTGRGGCSPLAGIDKIAADGVRIAKIRCIPHHAYSPTKNATSQ